MKSSEQVLRHSKHGEIMVFGSRLDAAKRIIAPLAAAFALAACSSDGNMFETASIAPAKSEPVAVAPIDNQCVTLARNIQTLRDEGTTGRLEKVADGKSSTVVVKRAALQKQAELNKVNAEFLAKCGPQLPITAAAPAPSTPAAATAPAIAQAAGAAQTTSGVSVVPTTAPAPIKQ